MALRGFHWPSGREQGLMMAETANGRGWPRTAGRSQEILSTFTRYVAERGYDGTNFSDIANELGISKGTIVHHYGTKDRLLAALHESYMRRRLAEARLIVERLDGPVEQLAGLLHAFIRYQVHDRGIAVVHLVADERMQQAGELLDRPIQPLDDQPRLGQPPAHVGLMQRGEQPVLRSVVVDDCPLGDPELIGDVAEVRPVIAAFGHIARECRQDLLRSARRPWPAPAIRSLSHHQSLLASARPVKAAQRHHRS